jgi:short-subunit dehydrogenase
MNNHSGFFINLIDWCFLMKIFITGASSGIGQALAKEYSKQYASVGLTLGLVARRSDELNCLASTLKEGYNVDCAIYVLDIRDSVLLKEAADGFMRRFGTPDLVIANAGVSRGTLTELTEDIPAFQTVFDTNVMGMVHTFSPFIRSMQDAKHGQLVGIASVAGLRGLPGSAAYSASKSAAITYLESLRIEMRPFGIAVTTIAPGYIRTPMTDINNYSMPFLMDVQKFAHLFIKAVKKKKRFVIIPWQMAIVGHIMSLMPSALWDWIMKNAPRKERIKTNDI